jgi:hypothetical protein
VDYLFLSKAPARIHAITDVKNRASQRVLEKTGFQRRQQSEIAFSTEENGEITTSTASSEKNGKNQKHRQKPLEKLVSDFAEKQCVFSLSSFTSFHMSLWLNQMLVHKE